MAHKNKKCRTNPFCVEPAECVRLSNVGDKTNPFFMRCPDIQEAILLNLFCDWCGRIAQGPINPFEYEQDGVTWVEATCTRCSKQVKIDVRDVP